MLVKLCFFTFFACFCKKAQISCFIQFVIIFNIWKHVFTSFLGSQTMLLCWTALGSRQKVFIFASIFFHFCIKILQKGAKCEKPDFEQSLDCASAKPWSKYTTIVNKHFHMLLQNDTIFLLLSHKLHQVLFIINEICEMLVKYS